MFNVAEKNLDRHGGQILASQRAEFNITKAKLSITTTAVGVKMYEV